MKFSILTTLTLCALFAAVVSKADGGSMTGTADRSTTEPGVIERWSDRALARMENWISRARSKITGSKDDSMQGCGDMMSGMQMQGGGMAEGMGMMQGGGMMGNMRNTKPNQQWLDPKPVDGHPRSINK